MDTLTGETLRPYTELDSLSGVTEDDIEASIYKWNESNKGSVWEFALEAEHVNDIGDKLII